jgi:hypothetical protein
LQNENELKERGLQIRQNRQRGRFAKEDGDFDGFVVKSSRLQFSLLGMQRRKKMPNR